MSYRKRKLYKLAEMDAKIMCGSCFHILPAEIYIKGDKETMLKETERIARQYKQDTEWFLDEWPLDDDGEADN
ncbi:MAG: hypothetical protein NC517_12725 [Firmicutes bacterium]|nr:hypothetical protein [Bacillota bacterium]